MDPAPMTSARVPSTGPMCVAAWSSATETSDGAGAVDVGLGVAALADAQRLLEQRVESRADGAVLLAAARGRRAPARGSGPRRRPSSPARRRPWNRCATDAVVVVHVEVGDHLLAGRRRRARTAAVTPPRRCRGSGRPRRRPRPGCRSRAPSPRARIGAPDRSCSSLSTPSASSASRLQHRRPEQSGGRPRRRGRSCRTTASAIVARSAARSSSARALRCSW